MTLKSTTTSLLVAICAILTLFIGTVAYAGETTSVLVQFEGPLTASDKAFVRGIGGEISHEYSLVPAIAVEIPAHVLERLSRNPRVLLVEEDMEVQAVFFDDEYVETWSIENLNASGVHQAGQTGVGVKVGIIDSGVDYNHPDLAGNYKGGQNFVGSRGKPVDEMDVYGHGTHVAGTVCATMNTWGAVGVAPGCDLYGLRVLNNNGSGRTSDILAAVEWAVDQGLDVVNLSLGSSGNPGATAEAVYQAAYDAGLVIVAAAGNSGSPDTSAINTIWPANYSSVIAVAATDQNDARAYFSSTGPNVELAAPGLSVHSTWNDSTSPYNPQPVCDGTRGCYKDASGTSMASPQVAGVVALIIGTRLMNDDSGNGHINDEVRALMQNTASDLGASGKDSVYGYGLVDASAAVASLLPINPQALVADAGVDQIVSDADADGVELVSFDASASTNSNGSIDVYEWDFDGDMVTDATGITTTESFSVSGSLYVVTLTVTADDGATSSDSVNITVLSNQTPVANAGVDQTVDDADQNGSEIVALDGGSSSDDGVITYSWSKGGIEIATGVNPDVVLPIGIHTITLTVTDGQSLTNTDDVVITVNEYVAPAPSTKFAEGDRVKSQGWLNVREEPTTSGTLVDDVKNESGTVIGGPISADGYWWWQVDYDNGVSGWSVENWLRNGK